MTIFPVVGDESVDYPVLRAIERLGYPVFAIALEQSGAADPEVLEITRSRGALLLTSDKDFGALVVRHREPCAGVVLLRLFSLTPQEMAVRVEEAFAAHSHELLGCFTVIREHQIRIRPLRKGPADG